LVGRGNQVEDRKDKGIALKDEKEGSSTKSKRLYHKK
jgi:hypothetical protein